MRSQFEWEGQTSVIFWTILEVESQAVGSRRGKSGDEVFIFELNSVFLLVGLFKVDGFGVEGSSVEFDVEDHLGERGVFSGFAELNK